VHVKCSLKQIVERRVLFAIRIRIDVTVSAFASASFCARRVGRDHDEVTDSVGTEWWYTLFKMMSIF
jgi:hypothetical protein